MPSRSWPRAGETRRDGWFDRENIGGGRGRLTRLALFVSFSRASKITRFKAFVFGAMSQSPRHYGIKRLNSESPYIQGCRGIWSFYSSF